MGRNEPHPVGHQTRLVSPGRIPRVCRSFSMPRNPARVESRTQDLAVEYDHRVGPRERGPGRIRDSAAEDDQCSGLRLRDPARTPGSVTGDGHWSGFRLTGPARAPGSVTGDGHQPGSLLRGAGHTPGSVAGGSGRFHDTPRASTHEWGLSAEERNPLWADAH